MKWDGASHRPSDIIQILLLSVVHDPRGHDTAVIELAEPPQGKNGCRVLIKDVLGISRLYLHKTGVTSVLVIPRCKINAPHVVADRVHHWHCSVSLIPIVLALGSID